MAHREPTESVRRNWSVCTDGLAIVLDGLKEFDNISDQCRQHGISQITFFNCRDKFCVGGKRALTCIRPSVTA